MANTVQLKKDGQIVYPVTDVSLIIGLQDAIKLPPIKTTTLPTASAETAGKMYYVGPDANDEYERYITSATGGSYEWIDLGGTEIPLPSIADNLTTDDANTALSAKQGKVLNEEIEGLEAKVDENLHLDFTRYNGRMVTTTGGYEASTNGANQYIVIPIRPGSHLKLTKTGTNSNQYAYLASFSSLPTTSSPFDIVGERHAMLNPTVEDTIPSTANYLYLLRRYNGTDWPIPILEIDGLAVNKAIDREVMDVQANIIATKTELQSNDATLNGKIDDINFSLSGGVVDESGATAFSVVGFIDKTTGEVTSSGYHSSPFILVNPEDTIVYKGGGSSSVAVIAYYDKDKVYLSSDAIAGPGTSTAYTINAIVPNGAKFVRMCTADSLLSSSEYNVTQKSTFVSKDDLAEIAVPFDAPIRLYPKTSLPCVSFIFDDCPDQDILIVDLLKNKGVRCGFAFIASEANIAKKGARYTGFQKDGFSVLSHSIDGQVIDGTLPKLVTSRTRMEDVGMIANGFVAPSSSAFDSTTLANVSKIYAYAFSDAYTGNGDTRTSDRCNLHRIPMQSKTVAQIKDYIDEAIANDKIFIFYGHAMDFGGTWAEEEWNIEKFETIVDYAITKRDAGLLYVGSPDDCVKYFFDL